MGQTAYATYCIYALVEAALHALPGAQETPAHGLMCLHEAEVWCNGGLSDQHVWRSVKMLSLNFTGPQAVCETVPSHFR